MDDSYDGLFIRCLFNSPNFNSPNSNYRVRVRVRDRVRVRVRDSVRRIEIRRIEKEPFIRGTIRTMDFSYHGLFVLWTVCTIGLCKIFSH